MVVGIEELQVVPGRDRHTGVPRGRQPAVLTADVAHARGVVRGADVADVERGVIAAELDHDVVEVGRGLEPGLTADGDVLAALDEEERSTLVAEPDGEALRFDIRLQGERQTSFFAL